MKRLKKFLMYASLIAALWIFSDILIYLSIHSTYKNIEARIYTNSPAIVIEESKATYVNGVIKGCIKNNTNEIINNKYIKIDFYSPRDIKLGSKYVEINNLQESEYKDFEIWYRFTDANYATVTVVDNAYNASEEEFLSKKTASYLVLGTLLVLYFM